MARAEQAKIRKRARRKFMTLPLATSLAELRGELEQSYRNTIYCANQIIQEDGTLKSQYCGNRWCMQCNAIRTARAINAYVPILSEWEAPHFVTLTVRNCAADELGDTIDAMMADFTAIKRSIRRTHGMEFKAVRKLECTANVQRGDYHPHFHLVVEGGDVAELFMQKWLDRHRETANELGQDVRPCDGEASLKELFKYFTKLTTKTRRGDGERGWMPPEMLDVIFRAMRRRRVYQPLGFTISQAEDDQIEGEEIDTDASPAIKRFTETVLWEWEQEVADWIDRSTGEVLAEYDPTLKFRHFVEGIEERSGQVPAEAGEARPPP